MSRLILHIDMDSYFASVEQQFNPYLRQRPIGVSRKPQDRTIIAAASREAKQFGLKSGMPIWEATRLCPDLIVVPGHPTRYAYVSGRIFGLLKRFSPLFEPFSIDEGFLDVTSVAPRYRGPERLALQIKSAIRRTLGEYVTCSIGIGPSKTVAKIASEIKKPNGLFWIKEEEVQSWFQKLPVDAARGINKGLKSRLNTMNVQTLADLGKCDAGRLRQAFGIWGHYLHLIGQGRDPIPLNPNYRGVPPKGFGHSRVFGFPYPFFEEAKDVLYLLCYKTARRMRGQGYAGRVVHFYAGNRERSDGRQRGLPLPTIDEQVIYAECLEIAQELGIEDEIRIIGASVSELSKRSGLPISMFTEARRREKLLDVMDKINDRWGDFTIYFAYLQPIKDRVSWNVASLGMHRELEISEN
jgi:DNA polymerase-4